MFWTDGRTKKEIENMVRGKDLKLGFALYDFSSGKAISINGNEMASASTGSVNRLVPKTNSPNLEKTKPIVSLFINKSKVTG